MTDFTLAERVAAVGMVRPAESVSERQELNWLLGLLALIFVAPLMLLVALAVFAHDGGPILFRHRRVGKNGKPFYCLKFRSMSVDSEERLATLLSSSSEARSEWGRDHKLRHDPRITPLGRFLRKSSLDELPQLFNVLRGEMNLVGPRPIVEAEIARYGRRFASYASVKPGITGLWQVSGRNDVSYRQRVAMDCLYARSHNLRLDAWIVAYTIPAVLARKGSY